MTSAYDGSPISPSKIAQYFSLQGCRKYLNWEYSEEAQEILENDDQDWDTKDVGPLLSEWGETFERKQLEAIYNERAELVAGPEDEFDPEEDTGSIEIEGTWSYTPDPGISTEEKCRQSRGDIQIYLEDLVDPDEDLEEAIFYQPPIISEINGWSVAGFADIIVLKTADATGTDGKHQLNLEVIEVKSSSEQKVPHQIQAATYVSLMQNEAERNGITINNVTARVVTESAPLTQGRVSQQEFDFGTRISDVQIFLQDDGPLDQALDYSDYENGFDDVKNRIAPRCGNCKYEPMCLTQMARKDDEEDYGLELLQLTPGTQERLAEIGVETLRDFAELYEYPSEDITPNDFHELEPSDQDTIEDIREYTNLSDIQKRAQIANRFVRELDQEGIGGYDFDRIFSEGVTEYLRGTGYNLPEDSYNRDGEPDQDTNWADYPWDSLIRVYLYVQHDPVLDRIVGLGANIRCERSDASTAFSSLSLDILDSEDDHQLEYELLHRFFGQIVEKIKDVAPNLEGGYESSELFDALSQDDGFVHFYLYSNHQREALTDGIRRHPTLHGTPPLRRLLGFREDIDQGMISIIQDELIQRHALRFPGLGLLQTLPHFYDSDADDGFFSWVAQNGDTEVNLWERFQRGFFKSAVYKNRQRGRTSLNHSEFVDLAYKGDGFADHGSAFLEGNKYPIINREQDQIPPEYIWAATGSLQDKLGIDIEDPEKVLEGSSAEVPEDEKADEWRLKTSVAAYLYPNGQNISRDEVEVLIRELSKAVGHIERSIWYKDGYYSKEQISLEEIQNFEPRVPSLAETCIEYQQLEFGASQKKKEKEYRRPLRDRLDTGNSIAFRCTRTPDLDPENDREDTRIVGQLLNSELEEANGGEVSTDPLTISEGDWVVLTRLDPHAEEREEQYRYSTPESIKHSPVGIIENLDVEAGQIRVNAIWYHGNWPNQNEPYMVSHNGWTAVDDVEDAIASAEEDEDQDPQYVTFVSEGESFVLDPIVDDISSSRALAALQACYPDDGDEDFEHGNSIYRALATTYRSGEIQGEEGRSRENEPPLHELLTIEGWSDTEGYLEILEQRIQQIKEERGDCDFDIPNNKQSNFIDNTSNKISVLQGPPGTGKTSSSTAPGILSRIWSEENRESENTFAGLVSAYSHDAVDEVLEDVHDLLEFCPPAEDVNLVRVNPSEVDEEQFEGVEYLNYNDGFGSDDDEETDVDRLEELYENRVAGDEGHVVFFGPPVTLRGFMDSVTEEVVPGTEDVEELYPGGECAVFDFAVIDEASMMDLPLLFLLGAFIDEDGQLQLVGDHRQMQPIRQHDWEAEDRKSIEKTAPFLSALDFIRFLRDELEEEKREYFDREAPNWEDLGEKDDLLPIERLTKTYRLPEEAANMHTHLFYYKDGISLQSRSSNAEIPAVDAEDPVRYVLRPSDRVTLLVHEDERATTYSEVESGIIQSLVDALDVASADSEKDADEVDVGVVVPYNDQASLIEEAIEEPVTVDTVEKFQGDDRNVMILSMTGSDPGHVMSQSDFLLNPNRFNVGASRMEQKVVIVASRSIFEAVTPSGDTTKYEDQMAWKKFYDHMGGFDAGAGRTYSADAFCDNLGDTDVTVYSGWDIIDSDDV